MVAEHPNLHCPRCKGSSFTIDTEAETESVVVRGGFVTPGREETVRRRCTVAFCNTCEFSIELNRGRN